MKAMPYTYVDSVMSIKKMLQKINLQTDLLVKIFVLETVGMNGFSYVFTLLLYKLLSGN